MDELDDKHPLEAGDRVMIKIAEDRDRKTSVWVQDNGNINCPYVGPVHAAGRTCKQLAGDIKRELEKKYFAVATVIIMHDPDPHRIIFCQGPPCFIIFGEVARQGKYELGLDEEITITQAILRAGGTASPASLRKVKLIRKTPKGNKTIIVNVDDILRHGKTSEDIPVHNGDVIIVPEPVHVPF